LNYSEVLQKYLLRIARGEMLETTSILPLLKAAKIFLPQVKQDNDNGEIKITFPILKKDGAKLIPVYLSRSNSASYSGTLTNIQLHTQEPIEIKGEILFQVMPKDVGIILEPSSSLEVIFSEEKIQTFLTPNSSDQKSESKQLDNFKSGNSEKRREKSSEETNQRPQTKDNNSNISQQVTREQHTAALQLIDGGKEAVTTPAPDDNVNLYSIADIENQLSQILSQYNSIDEAYLLEHISPHSELIIGILAKEWLNDQRFKVVESVAMLAKKTFGYAGAIEVYDDLSDTHANSWDLFKMIPPFFVANDQEKKTELKEDIEISESKRGIRGTMTRLTQNSIKLFSGGSQPRENN